MSLSVFVDTTSKILLPIVIAYAANQVSLSNKEKDSQLKLIELSTTILSKEIPTNQSIDNKNLRIWAIKTLNQYSQVPFDESTIQALSTTISFPSISQTYSIVISTDKTREQAEFEIRKAEKHSLHPVLTTQSNLFVVSIPYQTYNQAIQELPFIKSIFPSAFITN